MTPSSLRPQQGLAAAAVVIVLILVALAISLGRDYFRGEAMLEQQDVNDASLRKISDALVAYATLNGRLPCPAQGTRPTPPAVDGVAVPDASTATCTYPDGVVPWVTLGLRRSDAMDAWGGRISYRVYAPTASGDGFTRANGVSARNCSTEVAVGGPSEVVVDCDGSAAHLDHPVHFRRATADPTRDRGLFVNERGATVGGLAFVLVSHGRSGRGAFGMESGVRAVLPTSADELRNTQGPSTPVWISPFVINARSDASIAPDAAGHFDDVVSYMRATDLIERAKLSARAWPSSSLVADASTIQMLVPGFDPDDTQNTGRTSLAFGRVTVTARSNAGTQNIGFRERGGTGGIGVYSTSGGGVSGGSISSTTNEVLVLDAGAGSTFQKADIALNELQTRNFPPHAKERVELSLWRTPEFPIGDPPVLVQATTIESWHTQSDPSLCLLASIPGTVFDRLEIRPLVRSDGGSSSVTLAAIKACSNDVDTCTVEFGITDFVRCPNRPPGAATTAATGVGATTAGLNGTVTGNDAALSSVSFDVGLTTSFGSSASATVPADSVSTPKAVSVALTGLACNTTYYYRTRAVNAGGATVANTASFKTAACP